MCQPRVRRLDHRLSGCRGPLWRSPHLPAQCKHASPRCDHRTGPRLSSLELPMPSLWSLLLVIGFFVPHGSSSRFRSTLHDLPSLMYSRRPALLRAAGAICVRRSQESSGGSARSIGRRARLRQAGESGNHVSSAFLRRVSSYAANSICIKVGSRVPVGPFAENGLLFSTSSCPRKANL